ncbi:MAG: chondroitinase-B domain-containing protein, partial [Bdellovibrio sp.]
MIRLMSYFRIFFLVSFVTIPAWSLVYASTYHVRKDGSDTSCNGSVNASAATAPNCAFLTIQNGVSAAQAGDTVVVHSGDYTSASITSVRTGTTSSPITIQAAAGEIATISEVTINSGHDYVTVEGFQITGFIGAQGLFKLNGNSSKILNNYFYSNKTQDYYDAVAIYMNINTSNVLIDGNTFDGKSTPNKVGPSIYIPIAAKGSNQIISHNLFKDLVDPERIMDLNGFSNSTISNNEVRNVTYNGTNGAHVDIFQYFASSEPTQYVIIENNYFHDLQSQIGDLVDSTTAKNITFRNNIFANIDSVMFGGSPSMLIYNNTFYRVGNGVDPLLFVYAPGANNADIRNNIFYNCGNSDYLGWYGTNG